MALIRVTSEGLNLRAAPSQTGRIIDQLGYHDDLEFLSTKGNWIKVKHKKRGEIGWVYGDHTEPVPAPKVVPGADPEFPWKPVGLVGVAAAAAFILWLFT